jgi:hypothetical protein
VVLFAKEERTIISKNVRFEDSDHHSHPNEKHIPLYHTSKNEDQPDTNN